MSSTKFLVQAAVMSALTSSTAFMASVGSRVYDTPPDNLVYPYACIESCTTIPANRHQRKGWKHLFTFGVYTQPGLAGSYPMESIYKEMDAVINLKKYALTSSYTMITAQLISKNDFKQNDIVGSNITYDLTVFDSTNVT